MAGSKNVFTPEDTIILLLGVSGTGKSTFAKYASLSDGEEVGHTLATCTLELRPVTFKHPLTNQPIVLLDTPPVAGSAQQDDELLAQIEAWIKKHYGKQKKVAGIIYLHRISDVRPSLSPSLLLRKFIKLCEEDGYRRVAFATTMWNTVVNETEDNLRREAELKGSHWNTMIRNGASVTAFGDSFKSAWDIIDNFVQPPSSPRSSTATYVESGEVGELQKEQQELVRKLRSEDIWDEKVAETLAQRYREVQEQIQALQASRTYADSVTTKPSCAGPIFLMIKELLTTPVKILGTHYDDDAQLAHDHRMLVNAMDSHSPSACILRAESFTSCFVELLNMHLDRRLT